jgi:rare lipoprotein A
MTSVPSLLLMTACWTPEPEIEEAQRAYQVGTASWYGEDFAGRATASGEPYQPDALTAAHKRLPFGTEVEVSRADDADASVVVEINDRGPYAGGRILDLSRAAASELGMLAEGTAPVELRIVRCPPEVACPH